MYQVMMLFAALLMFATGLWFIGIIFIALAFCVA